MTGNDAGKGSLLAALAEAGFLIGVEKNSEAIEMASYAPLFVNDNDRRWNPDAIVFTSSQMYGTPSYWMQHFFKESNGATLLSSSLQANPSNSLIASAITWRNSVDNNEYLRIKVVNFGTTAVTLKISISGLDQNTLESSGAIKTTLTSTNVMDENSFKEPNKVSPVKAMLEKVSESMDVVLSPRSLTSFDLLRKSISSSVDTDSVLKSSY